MGTTRDQGTRLHVASLPMKYSHCVDPPVAPLPAGPTLPPWEPSSSSEDVPRPQWTYDDVRSNAEALAQGIHSLDLSGVSGTTDSLFLQLVQATVPTPLSSRTLVVRGSLLTELDISFCVSLSQQALEVGLAAMPSLTRVRAAYLPGLTSKALMTLAQTAPLIEELDVSGTNWSFPPQEYTHLTNLELESYHEQGKTQRLLQVVQSALESLDDSVLDAEGIVRAVQALKNLRILKVAHRTGWTPTTMGKLGGLTLEALDMSQTDVTDEGLAAYVQDPGSPSSPEDQLRTCTLELLRSGAWGTKIVQSEFWPPVAPRPGTRLRRLQRLSFATCIHITDAGMAHLAKCVPLLTVLDLSYTGVRRGLFHFGHHGNERRTYCKVGPQGLCTLLATTPHLERLSLDGNDAVDDSVLETLLSARQAAQTYTRGTVWADHPEPVRKGGGTAETDDSKSRLTHLHIAHVIRLSDAALANFVRNTHLVELVAPASGASTLTAQMFLEVQKLAKPSQPEAGVASKVEPLLNVVDCANSDDPFGGGDRPGIRPRRGRQGKVYASARFDGGRENVPPSVLRDLGEAGLNNGNGTTTPLRDRLRDFLPGSSAGAGVVDPKGTARKWDSNMTLWSLPIHQNLLSLQAKLHENDPTRLAVLCSANWDKVDALDEEVRKRDLMATTETARHARRKNKLRAQQEDAQKARRSTTDSVVSSVPVPSANLSAVSPRARARARARARRATADGTPSLAPTTSPTARDEPPPFRTLDGSQRLRPVVPSTSLPPQTIPGPDPPSPVGTRLPIPLIHPSNDVQTDDRNEADLTSAFATPSFVPLPAALLGQQNWSVSNPVPTGDPTAAVGSDGSRTDTATGGTWGLPNAVPAAGETAAQTPDELSEWDLASAACVVT